MNFTEFNEVFLHQVVFNCTRPNEPKYGNTEKKNWSELSWRDNVYNAKFNVNMRLDNAYPIEWTYF